MAEEGVGSEVVREGRHQEATLVAMGLRGMANVSRSWRAWGVDKALADFLRKDPTEIGNARRRISTAPLPVHHVAPWCMGRQWKGGGMHFRSSRGNGKMKVSTTRPTA